uniref:Uncharacterized protein n=1 Tax=Caulerpa racemosa TaxID=76317 RepID=A0A1I9LKB9_CAURA|nr:hypothetical protein [Caulerpa racemosa]ANJ70780.1 hypothetical protein [Caulerpa racemosa]
MNLIKKKKIMIKIEGINIKKLFLLEDLLFCDSMFNVEDSLCQVILVNAILCQISIDLNIDPQYKQNLDSISNYQKLFFSKNRNFISLCAAVAIGETMAVYTDFDEKSIQADFRDLAYNNSGPSNANFPVQAILTDFSKLRSYRRNIMLKTAGCIRSQSIFSPSSFYSSPDLSNMSIDFLAEIVSFAFPNITLNTFLRVSKNIKLCMEKSLGNTINWDDGVKIPISRGQNLTYLEYEIFGKQMSRRESFDISPKLDNSKIKDVPWKEEVAKQLEDLRELFIQEDQD